jgi:hypothetical protein
MNKIELLVPNSKIQKHKQNNLRIIRYLTLHMIPVTLVTCPSQMENPHHHLVPNPVETREHIKKLRMS